MNLRIKIALLLFLLGCLEIMDWIVYSMSNEAIASSNRDAFMSSYIDRFPSFIQPLYRGWPQPMAILLIVAFAAVGIVLLRSGSFYLKVISIISFLFSFWHLFSIM